MFIRRIVLLLLILSCSVGLAHAEWEELMTGPTFGGTTVYGDPTTHRIDKKSGLVKMWLLYDYKTAQIDKHQVPYMSKRIQQQYDCQEERARTLTQTLFDGNMASGNVVSLDSTETRWRPVAPDTIGKYLWRLACGPAKQPG